MLVYRHSPTSSVSAARCGSCVCQVLQKPSHLDRTEGICPPAGAARRRSSLRRNGAQRARARLFLARRSEPWHASEVLAFLRAATGAQAGGPPHPVGELRVVLILLMLLSSSAPSSALGDTPCSNTW